MSTPLRVLLVEDSEADAALVIGELRTGGYEPSWKRVDTVAALRAALVEQTWDVITCDYVLPALTALDALRCIRDMDLDLPVIIISGRVDEEVAVTAMKAGAHDYVSKHRLARLVPAVGRELADVEARRARKGAEEVYRAVFEHSLQGLEVWQDGQLVLVNPSLSELTGYSVEEMKAIPPLESIDRIIHPDDRAAVLAATARWLAGGGVGPRSEFRVVRKDGGVRRVMTGNANFVYRGRPATLVAWVDITDRWRAETALRELNSELEARVAERTAQLRGALQELETFSYSVSHDLRAPLRAIDGFTAAVLEDAHEELRPTAVDHLQRVRRATQRMGELIDQLLILSRVMRGELHRQRVDLSAMARDVAAELTRSEPQRRVALAIAEGLMGSGDAALLRAVLANLLGNAWKFTRPRELARIELGCRTADASRAYYVRDNGVGFDMEYATQLFRPFQRLHDPGEFDGSGIGLATVQRIIQRHGGKVWAESTVGHGATFFFTLGA